MDHPIQPVTKSERIRSLDILRGFAVLGILIMNIQSFSMPGAAYLNPMAYGDMTGINKWVWMLSHLFADQKFMTLFSVLFGAGIILMTERAVTRTGKSAALHYRRNFWLLLIGLLHAHLLWYGDILVAYAICALLVFPLRKWKPVNLLIWGIIIIGIHTLIYFLFGFTMDSWPAESLEQARESWFPGQARIEAEIAAITGSLSEQIGQVSATATVMETLVFLILFFWRVTGLMLIGMALYKWNILSAKRSRAFYIKGLLVGAFVGLALTGYGMYANFRADFAFEYSMYLGSQWNYWGSLFMAYSYLSLIMLLSQSTQYGWFKDRLAATGQMALTNYLTQSIICVFIFFGVGLGYFGQWERWSQILVVIVIMAAQLAWSKPWLEKHRFGPFEWAWRTLSYRKRQPMLKK